MDNYLKWKNIISTYLIFVTITNYNNDLKIKEVEYLVLRKYSDIREY